MSASRRVAVRFDDQVWNEAIRGFSGQALECALAARRSLDERGINLAELRPCLAEGPDGTQLRRIRSHRLFPQLVVVGR